MEIKRYSVISPEGTIISFENSTSFVSTNDYIEVYNNTELVGKFPNSWAIYQTEQVIVWRGGMIDA